MRVSAGAPADDAAAEGRRSAALQGHLALHLQNSDQRGVVRSRSGCRLSSYTAFSSFLIYTLHCSSPSSFTAIALFSYYNLLINFLRFN